MKAAVLEAFGEPLVVRDVPDPVPGAAGAVVRVEASGVCRSDWHAWIGDWPKLFALPHVLGHEMSGVVVEVGAEVGAVRPGDRVVVAFSGGDGRCAWCRAGLPHLCDRPVTTGFNSWGGFAELVAVDHADLNLVALPGAVSFVAGAGLGCRFMTAFHALVHRGRVGAGEWIAVFGCGGVGLSVIQIGCALGASVIAVDVDAGKLAFARELGAAAIVDASADDNPARSIRSLTGGGAHLAVDALGLQATCEGALKSLRKRGRHVQIGLTTGEAAGSLRVPVDMVVQKEIEIIGSYGMPPTDYDAMMRMVTAGRLDPARLVRNTIALEDAGAVLAAMSQYDTMGITVIDRF